MAKFEITSPDGKRFEITAPEGATQEQVLQYAQQQQQPAPLPKEPAMPNANGSPPVEPSMGQKVWDFAKQVRGSPMTGGPMGMMAQQGMKAFNEGLDKTAYGVGGAATDALAGKVPPEIAAAGGTLANMGVHALPTAAGAVAGKAMEAGTKPLARGLYQSALKPSSKDIASGDSAKAIETMLKGGFPASTGGVAKMRTIVQKLSKDVDDMVAASPATVDKALVRQELAKTLRQFKEQVDPDQDVKVILQTWDRFKNHRLFRPIGKEARDLTSRIEGKYASKADALQDSGRFSTTAAQQETLAHGGVVSKTAGGSGNPSPVARPVEGMPRVPGRITTNIERVPEAQQAAKEAAEIASQRQKEMEFLSYQLRSLKEHTGDGIPVDLAHRIKKGTYKILADKYSHLGTVGDEAGTQAQMSMARGLRKGIEKGVPSVVKTNKDMAELINAIEIAERRAGISGNRDIAGIAWLAETPVAGAGMLADRSPYVKSALARLLYSGMPQTGALAGTGTDALLTEPERRK